MKFSIIIPSYNQDKYIEKTFKNLSELKKTASQRGFEIELLLLDSCSNEKIQAIIKEYHSIFDYIDISKDKGQCDAINKGISKITGSYWTWLNTDDYIDIDGFLKLATIISNNNSVDYIYGGIAIINGDDQLIRNAHSYELSMNHLLHWDPAIFQPGSFFKKGFTDKIGLLSDQYCACFDYEYVLRLFINNAKFYRCNFILAQFRYYDNSKSGSIVPTFIKEQLMISKLYGRRFFSFMTIFLNLRLIKHRLFPK